MKLELLGLNFVKKGQQVKWLQDILLNDYQVPNPGGIDGKLGTLTDKQIRDYQEEKEIKVDGIVGEQTTMKLVNESSDPKKWFRNLQIYMAYE
jgi:peptidoglycan hydrolase-like protein with peptidoglycan-binding domain